MERLKGNSRVAHPFFIDNPDIKSMNMFLVQFSSDKFTTENVESIVQSKCLQMIVVVHGHEISSVMLFLKRSI